MNFDTNCKEKLLKFTAGTTGIRSLRMIVKIIKRQEKGKNINTMTIEMTYVLNVKNLSG